MLREVLIGEAMHALGIPTTRALAVVAIALGWWLGVMHSRRDGGYTSGARCR